MNRNINTLAPVSKRYFTTQAFSGQYPPEFVSSDRKKYVHVLAVYIYQNGDDDEFTRPNYIQFHASFVQDSEYLDSYVCMGNQPLYQRKKYEQFNSDRTYRFWLTDYEGNAIDPVEHDIHIIVELMLEY